MKRSLAVLTAVALAGGFAFANPATSGPEYKNKYASGTESRTCEDGTVTYNGPAKLWPPNHKLQNVSVTATEADNTADGVDTELSVVPEADEVAGGEGTQGAGGPNHDPDWQPGDLVQTGDPSATIPFWVRAERSGRGDGRVYTIHWEAVFDMDPSTTCTSMDAGQSPFTIEVPHDMRGGADWKE